MNESYGIEQAHEAIRQLPMVEETAPGQFLFWNIDGVGSDGTDIQIGEMCGGLALKVAREFDAPFLIAFIMRDMINAGRFTGVEAGFVASIAGAAKVGSNH